MVGLGELMMSLDLHRQGLSPTAIARQLGIDRKTVRKYIADRMDPPNYRVQPRRELCIVCRARTLGRLCPSAARSTGVTSMDIYRAKLGRTPWPPALSTRSCPPQPASSCGPPAPRVADAHAPR